MRFHRSLSAVCLLAASTLACHDVTRAESDLPGTYVLEVIDNQLLPVRGSGSAKNCRITGGMLTLNAGGTFILRDALDCRWTTYGSLASMYGGGLVPSPSTIVSQTGTYTPAGTSLALHFGLSFIEGGLFSMTPVPKDITAPYSSEAIALDPTRFYGDTVARRRVYIRVRGGVTPDM